MDFDIYFDDLAAEVQQEILEYYGINNVYEETNWDIMPIATIYNYEGNDDEWDY